MSEILLPNGMAAIIDDEDYDRVARLSWIADRRRNTWYARHGKTTNGKRYQVYLHRFVLPEIEGLIDHVNHNGLDCRKTNLRPCTGSQNLANSSKGRTRLVAPYKGIHAYPVFTYKSYS